MNERDCLEDTVVDGRKY